MSTESSLERQVEKQLQHFVDAQSKIVLAFSGGLDSCVLLHFLQKSVPNDRLLAWHIHHGLLDCADDMACFCQNRAAEYRVNFKISHLNLVGTQSNLESIAREARYSEFENGLNNSDLLLTAHHADDQVETLLLNLFRGSGSSGLRGIAHEKKLSRIRVLRPLLQVSKIELYEYAKHHVIEWFEDPSNQNDRFDRNYLRQQIVPKIRQRWPGLLKSIERVCQIQSETQHILDEVAQADYRRCHIDSTRLKKEPLVDLSSARQKNLIRYWLRMNQLNSLPTGRLKSLIVQLQAQHQAHPVIQGKGYDIRIYNNQVYVVKPVEKTDLENCYSFNQESELQIPLLEIKIHRKDIFYCLKIKDTGQEIQLGFRTGSLLRASEKHRLKRLFQSYHIPPWMRDRTPLIFIDGILKDLLIFESSCMDK